MRFRPLCLALVLSTLPALSAVAQSAKADVNAPDAQGTPPLGIHIVMGRDFKDKTGNLLANLERGLIAPVEMIGRAR